MNTDVLSKVRNEEAISAVEFKEVLDAVQKVVNVKVDQKDLAVLKSANYRMCFAKKVGSNAFNVVWQSYHDYLTNGSFSWTPQFQLFGSNSFVSNVKVKMSTDSQVIGLGETCILDKNGVLQAPTTGGSLTSLTMKNEYGSIHPGVNQISIGITGQQVATPIYVSEEPIVMGDTALTPVEKVLVWFEQNIETSTMFSDSRSKSIELDLTTINEKSILYKDQKWSII